MSVSILIQTLNEEQNLPGLLESLAGFDDVVVLDSLSTDGTRRVAEAGNCRWFERAFDGRGPHQTWAMKNIDFKYRWVFYLDADERMTPQLKDEIEAIAHGWEAGELTEVNAPVAYYCGRRNFFRGKWIRHAMPPGNIMRFFQPPCIEFERLANPVPTVRGRVGYLKQHFTHYNFSKGLRDWIDRHNRYSTYEAIETVRALESRPLRLSNLISSDRNTRRLELKNLSFHMPLRPVTKFIYMYFLGRGFMDGRAGLTYCTLQAIYEYFIVIKAREIREPEKTSADRGEQPATKPAKETAR